MDRINLSVFDVKLLALTHDYIEQVRIWRTDPKISQHMGTQIDITPQMQEDWFLRVNNIRNYYYIIEYNHIKIGVVNIRNIDYNKKEGETGIFIYDESFTSEYVSYKSYIGLFDFCFTELGLNKITALILKENIRSIKFHQKFGFKILPRQEDVRNQEYELTKELYLKYKNSIVAMFSK